MSQVAPDDPDPAESPGRPDPADLADAPGGSGGQATLRLTVEDTEDALLEGDRPFAAGTARAALSYPIFRRVYTGAFLSNVGSWMQNVVLGAYGYSLTHSATFVSLLAFAQLVPLMLLSMIGGALADRFDRKWLIILVSIEQTIFALGIAWITRSPDPSELLLLAFVLAMGIGQAVYAPAYSSVMPELVDERDLVGAVSLNSVNMNLSRVIGPAIGSLIYARWGVSWVFVGNAVSYLFIIGALLTVTVPPVLIDPADPQGLRRLLGGFAVARRDRVVGRCLLDHDGLLAVQPGLRRADAHDRGQEPRHRHRAHHLRSALRHLRHRRGGRRAVDRHVPGRSSARAGRSGRAGRVLGQPGGVRAAARRSTSPSPWSFVLGFFYFATVTSLATVLQSRLDNQVRGRVMALWIMAFGGTVAIGGLVAGPLMEATSVTAVMLLGAVVAVILVPFADLHDHSAARLTARNWALECVGLRRTQMPSFRRRRRGGRRRGVRGRRRGWP